MYTLSINMWFQKLMKQFFFGIDQVVYNFISTIYDLLISIARTSILSQADILDMADKIYKLLAVFMIFKVTFSLITYVVNPDDFSDKSKGISKLATNIIISLGLLILTPYIFNMAYRLQTIILEDNTLATLIFSDDEEDSNSDFLNTAGDTMAFMAIRPFFVPNTSIVELQDCVNLTDGNGRANEACTGIGNDTYNNLNDSKSMVGVISENGEILVQNYVAGINHENLGLYFRQELAVATNSDKEFVMEYKYIFSTIVGVVIVLLLISFCMDVALRSIKLAFLQLIAPIPILSYVDPKSGKDGMFKKWYQLCFKTYLSLFIRLLALYFAIYIISRIESMTDIVDGTTQTNLFVIIFIIIGALMFAKQFPKILEGLGIKLDGDGKFTLNPFKKFENEALGGKNITGAARGALVGAASGRGLGIGGALGGAFRGAKSGKGWKETGKAEAEMNRKMRQAKLDGSTFTGRLGARFAGATGFRSASENIAREKSNLDTKQRQHDDRIKSIEDRIAPTKRKIAEQKNFSDAVKSMEDRAKSEIEAGNSWVGQEYISRKSHAEYLMNNRGKIVKWQIRDADVQFAQREAAEAYKKGDMNLYQEKLAEADMYAGLIGQTVEREVTAADVDRAQIMANSWLNDDGMKAYMTDASRGDIDDATFRNARENAKQAGETIGVALSDNGSEIHSQYGKSKGTAGELGRSIHDDEQAIEQEKLEKAKLGDELRDIGLREQKAKADETAIK